jgi:hypothetical protein|tara:strand:+ start:441 stop:653 length:213 start_codon:yes stop_codon:yes gene_type:complete
MITMKKDKWQHFTSLYGEEMYKDKLTHRTRQCDEDPNSIEITFGQGIEHNGYNLVEEYLTFIKNQGKTNG